MGYGDHPPRYRLWGVAGRSTSWRPAVARVSLRRWMRPLALPPVRPARPGCMARWGHGNVTRDVIRLYVRPSLICDCGGVILTAVAAVPLQHPCSPTISTCNFVAVLGASGVRQGRMSDTTPFAARARWPDACRQQSLGDGAQIGEQL
jgi:hypothetical protein